MNVMKNSQPNAWPFETSAPGLKQACYRINYVLAERHSLLVFCNTIENRKLGCLTSLCTPTAAPGVNPTCAAIAIFFTSHLCWYALHGGGLHIRRSIGACDHWAGDLMADPP